MCKSHLNLRAAFVVHNTMEPVIFFASPPDLDKLCGITVRVTTLNGPHFLPTTTVQPHVIKCREMIFTESEVIACPSYDLDHSFNMVLQQSHFKSGRVHAKLKNQGLELSKPYKVHPYMYQSCVRYTVLARLAPAWNKAGEWLLQGRNFLMHCGYTNAIRMDLCVNKDEMYISLAGTVVKFPPLQVEDLNLSQAEMRSILESTEGDIREVALADCWCHVLPSMKTGKISSLSVRIPKESPFNSYKDLKRHWKNMYGYRLPETDEDILYCQVGFMVSGGGKQFTYPSVCLRARPLQVVQRVDPKPILTTFLQDVHSKVNSICGNPMRFQPKIRYTTTSLHLATEETKQPSLKTKSNKKPLAPLRNIKAIAHLYNNSNREESSGYEKQTQDQKISQFHKCSGDTKDNSISISGSTELCSLTNNGQIQCSTANRKDGILVKETNVENTEDNAVCSSPNEQRLPKISEVCIKEQARDAPSSQQEQSKPVFQQDTSAVSIQSSGGAKLFPLFRPKAKQTFSGAKKETNSFPKDSTLDHFVPKFKPKKVTHTHITFEDKDKINTLSPQLCNPAQVSPVGNSAPNAPNEKSSVQREKPEGSRCSKLSIKQGIKSAFVEKTLQSPLEISNGETSKTFTSDLKFANRPQKHAVFGVSSSVMPSITSIPSQAYPSSDNGGVKRKNQECDSSVKKPRAKPQIQDLNVESLTRVNQLKKVNAATLTAWLKERGVTCKSKDKKTDLVERVVKHLGITIPES